MRAVVIAGLCALAALAVPAAAAGKPSLRVTDLRVDYMTDPVGIDDETPSLSWRLTSQARDQVQRAYQVRVSDGRRVVWDSGRVRSDDSVGVPYRGPALRSRQQLEWTVRVWGERGVSRWAPPARWEMGLLERSDWKARWVTDPAMQRRSAEPLVIRFPARSARYLRLDVTRLGRPLKEGWPDPVSRLQLAELEAYGAGTLRSRGATATASESYTVGGAWEPRFLTDGTLNSDANPRGYTSYERHGQDLGDRPIWVAIDLGSVTTVDEVRLYPRTDTLTADNRTANFPEDFAVQTRTEPSGGWSDAHRVTGQAAPQPPPQPTGLPLLARTFTVAKPVRSARLYAAGLGISEARLNGHKVGDAVLEPANTDYRKRVLYSTYDVTDQVRSGTNTLGFMLGNGVYNVPAGSGRYTKFTGSMGPLKLLAQLEVTYADGSRATIASDGSWRAESGPTTFSNWFGGEDYDARREIASWDEPGVDLSSWRPAEDLGGPAAELALSAQQSPPVRVQETVTAVSRKQVAPGVWLYDLGRNLAGWPELTLRAAAGQTAVITPGEKLSNGRVTQAEIGGPVYFRFTPAGDGAETWHPRFMYYGFRYVEIRGVDEPPAAADVRAKVLRADNERAGDVTTSDPTLNATYDMVQRAIESNMLSVLTDCPHREKLGWLEQYHLLYDTVAANFDVAAYYRKLVRDMTDAQLPDGMVPDIAPEYTVFAGGFRDDANWGGALIMAPYKHWQAYGDDQPLREAYPAMRRYMDYLASKASGDILSHGLGDWGAFDTSTPLAIPATTAYFRYATIMAEIARLVGDSPAAGGYEALAGDIEAAFNARFLDAEAGSYGSGSQASNALPLAAGIVPEEHRAAVLASLREDIAQRGDHLSTGEIGLRALFDVLGEDGDADTVYAMATNPTAPSYAAMLASGATTLPEFWDGRGSQNHFMMGAIDDWSHRYLGGVRPLEPGFKAFVVAPLVPRALKHVAASWASPYGTIESAWRKRDGGRLELRVTVPVNTSAEVRVPVGRERSRVTVDGRVVWDGRRGHGYGAHADGDRIVLEGVGSGTYVLESEPLERIEPELHLSVTPERRAVAPGATQALAVQVDARATRDAQGTIVAHAPAGWTVEPASAPLAVEGDGWPARETAELKLMVPAGAEPGEYPVRVIADAGGGLRDEREVVLVVPSLAGAVYVSDLPWLSESNGWGPAERDRSNGEQAAGDGPPIRLGGRVFEKGIGAHAPSEIVVAAAGRCSAFAATVGIDDARPAGSGNGNGNGNDHGDWGNARLAC